MSGVLSKLVLLDADLMDLFVTCLKLRLEVLMRCDYQLDALIIEAQ